MNAEGWYQDPYRRHQDRWYSDGTPTALVRGDDVEGHDPPPADVAPAAPLVPSVGSEAAAGPADMRRADDPEAGQDPNYGEKAENFFPFRPGR
jgi:hypothetical protein